MLRPVNRWIDQELGDITVQRGMAVIAEVVQRGRQGAGITQQRLADAVGMNQSTISRLERGELRAMRMVRLARVIGTLVEFGGLPSPEHLRGRRQPTHERGPAAANMPSTNMIGADAIGAADSTHLRQEPREMAGSPRIC